MGDKGTPAMVYGQMSGGEGLCNRTDLIEFDEGGVGNVLYLCPCG